MSDKEVKAYSEELKRKEKDRQEGLNKNQKQIQNETADKTVNVNKKVNNRYTLILLAFILADIYYLLEQNEFFAAFGFACLLYGILAFRQVKKRLKSRLNKKSDFFLPVIMIAIFGILLILRLFDH